MHKGRKIARGEVKVGMTVIAESCASEHKSCWMKDGKFVLTKVINIDYDGDIKTENSVCHCNDETVSLYLWEEEKTWDNLAKGDQIQALGGPICEVEAVLDNLVFYQGTGQDVLMNLKGFLSRLGFVIIQPTPPPAETIEVLGKKYKADEVKERLSELKEVE